MRSAVAMAYLWSLMVSCDCDLTMALSILSSVKDIVSASSGLWVPMVWDTAKSPQGFCLSGKMALRAKKSLFILLIKV